MDILTIKDNLTFRFLQQTENGSANGALAAPDSPTSPKDSPLLMEKLTPSTALTLPTVRAICRR